MTELPRVSLLMPAYNGVRYIKAAIDSVKAQTYRDWELIIVDDDSIDGTWELAKALVGRDKRIKVYQNDINLGIPKNRKRAFEYSSGSLVGHLDNDDMLERYSIEEMVCAFLQRPEIMLIYSDISQIGVYGEQQLYSQNKDYDPSMLHLHGWRHFGGYQRSVMGSISGYNEQLKSGCEDGDLFMQIAEKFPIMRLPKPLYLYRVHPDNSGKNNKECKTCSERPLCNYARVWCKSAGYDIATFTPLPKPPEITDGK